MNAIKNALVTTTLIAVGYGVYVILANPAPVPTSSASNSAPPWGKVSLPDGVAASQDETARSWSELTPPELSLEKPQKNDPPASGDAAPAVAGQGDGMKSDVVSTPTLPPRQREPNSVPGSIASAPASFAPNLPNADPPQQASELSQSPPQPSMSALSTASGDPPPLLATEGGVPSPSPLAEPDPYLAAAAGTDAPENGALASSSSPSADRSAAPSEPSTGPAETPGGPFEIAWQTAQRQLQEGAKAKSLFSLSIWHQDPSLSEVQRTECLRLLDELAADVIYSRDHYLQPAYICRAEDRLETIADQFQIPVEFLARVNGIQEPYRVTAGESIKVVQGPFRAELDIRRREMTLYAGSYYAGRVAFEFGQDASIPTGDFVISRVLANPMYVHPVSQEQIAGGDPRNPYGRVWLGLSRGTTPEELPIGIHGSQEAPSAPDLRGSIRLAARDAEDIQAVLSVGSAVIIR